jgi:cell division protein FtsB
MKEIFSQLRQRERRILGLVGILFLGSLVFYFLADVGVKGGYYRSQDTLSDKQTELNQQRAGTTAKKAELDNWEEALLDMDDLNKNYFYQKEMVVQQLRLDLDEIFRQIGVLATQIKYDYSDYKNEKISKIFASFHISGSYYLMKRFVYITENFPRFLIIEKIAFIDIDTQTGNLELDITLAGCYEN